MRQLAAAIAVLMIGAAAQAGPVLNGSFETGNFANWTTAIDPASGPYAPLPAVVEDEPGTGIAADTGNGNYYAALTTAEGDNPVGTDVWSSVMQSNVTLGGSDGQLGFTLYDIGDPTPPTVAVNETAMLLDNVVVSGNTLSFDYYGLTKLDSDKRLNNFNDYFAITFAGTEIGRINMWELSGWQASLGGGGMKYGAFTYGTGWNSTTITIPPTPPIPEPGTWMLMTAGVLPLVRRRRK